MYNLRLIHVVVWQKSQHCNAVTLQLKKKKRADHISTLNVILPYNHRDRLC